MERLTNRLQDTDPSTLGDYLACILATIEDGLLTSGFTPEKDYSRRDLLNAALPMVTSAFNEGSLTFTCSWNTEYLDL